MVVGFAPFLVVVDVPDVGALVESFSDVCGDVGSVSDVGGLSVVDDVGSGVFVVEGSVLVVGSSCFLVVDSVVDCVVDVEELVEAVVGTYSSSSLPFFVVLEDDAVLSSAPTFHDCETLCAVMANTRTTAKTQRKEINRLFIVYLRNYSPFILQSNGLNVK